MTKIKFIELAALRNDVSVSAKNKEAWEKLHRIGTENLEENGVELIEKIKLFHGINNEEICLICNIRKQDFEKVLSGQYEISRPMAEKLSKLGYPSGAFRRRAD